MGIAYLIDEAIDERDLATLLVGIATRIIACILHAVARAKMKHTHLAPERTIDTVERTPDAARGDLTHSGATR